jgi:hypothetical protein
MGDRLRFPLSSGHRNAPFCLVAFAVESGIMAEDAPEWRSAQWREASAEARAVLQIVIRWRLEPSGWLRVKDALEGMTAAVAAVDAESLRREIAHLELLGPFRVSTRLGDPPKEPAPEDIRERVNLLIDALVPQDGQVPIAPE